MRWRATIAVGILGAAVASPHLAQAQFSPQGLLGGITRPFRQMLGHFGHYPRGHRHRTAAADSQATAGGPANEAPGSEGARLGWAGPPAWANAYEDILGFTFWPDDYAPRLRSRGFDVIADTITGHFDTPRRADRVATTGTATGTDANYDSSKSRCDDAGTQAVWPATRVEQILQLTDSEHDAIDKFQSAVVQSMKPVKSDCGASADMSPPAQAGGFGSDDLGCARRRNFRAWPTQEFLRHIDRHPEEQLREPPPPTGAAGRGQRRKPRHEQAISGLRLAKRRKGGTLGQRN